jgi:hypothetical protein
VRRREPSAAGGREDNRWAMYWTGEREKLLGMVVRRRIRWQELSETEEEAAAGASSKWAFCDASAHGHTCDADPAGAGCGRRRERQRWSLVSVGGCR